MATRQYIGARYIPIFADPVEWDNTRDYEHLMMVQHQGETYLSQQAVPIGINLPDTSQGEESNEYWVHMSNWNAQVETYRQEVLQYNNRILTLENDLPISSFSDENTVKDAIDDLQDQIGEGFSDENTVEDAIDDLQDQIGEGFTSTDNIAAVIGGSYSSENSLDDAITELQRQDSLRPICFANVAAMKASTDIHDGEIVRTNGFYSSGDGAGAWYAISDTGTANEMDVIACGDLYATLIVDNLDYFNGMVLGIAGDDTDESDKVQRAIDIAEDMGIEKVLFNADIAFKQITISQNMMIDFNGKKAQGIRVHETTNRVYPWFICTTSGKHLKFENIAFTGYSDLTDSGVKPDYDALIQISNVNTCDIVNCTFKNISGRWYQNMPTAISSRGFVINCQDVEFFKLSGCIFTDVNGEEITVVGAKNKTRKEINAIFEKNVYNSPINTSVMDFIGNNCVIRNNVYNYDYAGSYNNCFGLSVIAHDELVNGVTQSVVYDNCEETYFQGDYFECYNIKSPVDNGALAQIAAKSTYIHDITDYSGVRTVTFRRGYDTTNTQPFSSTTELDERLFVLENVNNLAIYSSSNIASAVFQGIASNCKMKKVTRGFILGGITQFTLDNCVLFTTVDNSVGSTPLICYFQSDNQPKNLIVKSCKMVNTNDANVEYMFYVGTKIEKLLVIGNTTTSTATDKAWATESLIADKCLVSNNIGIADATV